MSDYQEKEKLSFELKEKDSSPQESETLHAKPVLTPGQTLAKHYEIISELGRGGNSIVYRARHLLLDEPCALKLLLPDRIPNEKAIRRFQQEAKAVSRLAHPNIIRLREFGIDDSGRPFLAMDFVEGTPLSSMIEGSGQLSVGQTIDLVSIACDALRHAHGEGVVHRDIKPSNILVGKGKDGTPTPKIVDFGIAKLEAQEQALSLTETGEVFGSPLYMSPEQCLGKPVDERTDVYALGCVLYECVFGKPPFTGESAIETLMAHVQEEPSIDESVCGKPLKRVIERCLAKSQADRYQSIAALQEDLSKAKRGEEPRHGAAKRRTGDKAAIRHNPNPATIVLIVAALATCAFLVYGLTNPQTRQFFSTGSQFDMGEDRIHPHEIRALQDIKPGDEYAEADRADESSRQYFMRGDYPKAIDQLSFAIKTFKEGGRHYDKTGDTETTYLAMAYMHRAECYVMLNQNDKATSDYREALRLYARVKNSYVPMYEQAVRGYAGLLRAQGKAGEARRMLDEYQASKRVTNIP